MANYRLSQEAENDLNRIWIYGLDLWGLTQADEYLVALFERFEQLAEQPRLYPVADGVREGYRRSVCGVDTIYYRIDGDWVDIMAIIGKQDLKKVF